MPKTAKVVSVNLALLAAVLLAAEIIFGTWMFGPKYGFLNIPRNTVRQFDVSSLYPGGGIITYSRDRHGFRGPYADVSKIDLLVMGGSTTNELYMDDSKTWSARLAHRFAGAGNPKTVVNAGLEGQSTVGHLKNFDVWFPKAQFAKRRHGLVIAASRQALGDGWSPSSMRWNHLR